MTPDLIKRCAEAISPERGQTALALALGVKNRTVRRWVAGEYPVPSNHVATIARILRERSSELATQANTCAALAADLSDMTSEKKSRVPEKTS